jgi:hypothetical protein
LIQKKAIIVRMQLDMNMPEVQKMLAQQASVKDPAHPVDPTEPLIAVTMEVDQISVKPIADSVFEVPADYHVVSIPEFLKAMLPVPLSPTAAGENGTDSAPAVAESEAPTEK